MRADKPRNRCHTEYSTYIYVLKTSPPRNFMRLFALLPPGKAWHNIQDLYIDCIWYMVLLEVELRYQQAGQLEKAFRVN